MAVNGINSYGMGYYNYQSSINNIRLTQALSNNPKFSSSAISPVSSVSPVSSSLKSGMSFIREYSSSMSDLMSAANELRGSNFSGAMNDMAVTSSDVSVAAVTQKLPLRSPRDIQLNVTQLAQVQRNVSDSVNASDAAQTNMDFTAGNAVSSVNVQVNAVNEDGTAKTNIQMFQEAADQINKSLTNVRASVMQEKGIVSLALESKSAGKSGTFSISGELGIAAGADKAVTEASNAKYSVTMNGKTTEHESSVNTISVDSTRIGVTLKDTGKTTIRADVDVSKVSTAVSDLVSKYNSSLKLLNDNYDRGTGIDRQLRNLVAGLGSEQSLAKLGITVNKDATLKVDKSVLEKNMKDNPSLTKDLISGTGGIADKAFSKAMAGMGANSGSLINNDLANTRSDSLDNPYNVFSLYSRSGTYSTNNYYAVGMMMNLLV